MKLIRTNDAVPHFYKGKLIRKGDVIDAPDRTAAKLLHRGYAHLPEGVDLTVEDEDEFGPDEDFEGPEE